MKIENVKIPVVPQQFVFELWEEKRSKNKAEAEDAYKFFQPILETIHKSSIGEYYWQIYNNAQPFPRIVMAYGAVAKLTPVDAERIKDVTFDQLFSFYHPDDLNHVITFISTAFPLIFKETPDRRKNYSISIYTRIKNGEGLYIWNCLQYPALYFDENDQLLYGIALFTNVHHLIKPDSEPMMTFLDTNDPNNQIVTHYTLKNIQGIQKNHPTVSAREREIISLLSQGKASKQIADLLGISKNTVDNHRQRLLKKFDVKSSSELVIKALLC